MKLKHILLVIALAGGSLVMTLNLLRPADARAEKAAPTAPLAEFPTLADFEGGVPEGWFVYNGGASSVAAFTQVISDTDPAALPGQIGYNELLSTTFSVADFAGFGANFGAISQDWTSYDAFTFWFYGQNSGLSYQAEVFDGGSDADHAERWDYDFTDDFIGWQQIIIPFSAFNFATDFQPYPDDGILNLTTMWGWVFPLPGGAAAFYLDNVALTNLIPLADFAGGPPAGWFVYNGGGSSVTAITELISDTSPIALPGQIGSNELLSTTFTIGDFAGFGVDFGAVSQDWSSYNGLSFWFYGQNSGLSYQVEVFDGGSDADHAERWDYNFSDDFNGWKLVAVDFDMFNFATDFQPYPDDGILNLTTMWGWVFPLPAGAGSFYLDYVNVYGDAAILPLTVQFDSPAYNVPEAGTATIVATLNMTASYPVTVTYATADGSATAGADYTAAAGTLVFPANTLAQAFTVDTIDDGALEGDETVLLALSDPLSVTLGSPNVATLTIVDDEQPSPNTAKLEIVDDYELTALVNGMDGAVPIGWFTFNAPTAAAAITLTQVVTDGVPEPVPGLDIPNTVLQMDTEIDTGEWAGFVHAFENETVDVWTPQDWSSYEGVAFWLYGNNTGGTLFLDILDNRNPGSTTDDAERFSLDIADDFSGWRYFEIPFTDFNRKDIGNGAPNDGFTLTEVHGYGFGAFGSAPMGAQANFIDQFALVVRVTVVDDYELAQLPSGSDGSASIGWITFNAPTAAAAITLTQVVTDGTPEPIPGTGTPNTVLEMDTEIDTGEWAGFVHAFANETVDTWTPQDWSTYEGVCFWLYGNNTGGTLFLDILDNRNPGSTVDDAERFSLDIADDFSGWRFFAIPFNDFNRKEIGNGAPDDGFTLTAIHGYGFGAFGSAPMGAQANFIEQFAIYGNTGGGAADLTVSFSDTSVSVPEGETAVLTVTLNMSTTYPISVSYRSAEGYATPGRDYTAVNGSLTIPAGDTTATFTLPTLDDAKYEGDENLMLVLANPVSATLGFQHRTVLTIEDNEAVDPTLVHDFEGYHSFLDTTGDVTFSISEIMSGSAMERPGQDTYEKVLAVAYDTTGGPASFTETFVQGQDWSGYEGLGFWYYGSGSGETITVNILDNQLMTTADVDPADWTMVWQDEFEGNAGTLPNPNVWRYEIGDGTLNGIPGWGNSESEYYTDSADNAALDGSGNLALTMQEVNTHTSDLVCWYGPCEYTSARLISWDRMAYEYGRVEARVKVPDGPDGLWPAFWALGTDLDEVGWPQAGEIDIMEYVSRIPNEIFGTIHGPGYSGGSAFGNTYDFGVPVADDYHVFTIEWGPDEIHWYVDGINYHNAAPSDVPGEWVYNHPFFLLLNLAIGGNFGGNIDPGIIFPQTMLVDYVRVYQAEDTAERFTASFADDTNGWKQVTLPFSSFIRSANQPDGAPDDGFTLNNIWGYAFELAAGSTGAFHLDYVQVLEDLTPTVQFDNTSYAVDEAGTATIVATLNMTSSYPITVTYATADGSATAGVDYSAASGTLVFPPDSLTQTFTVDTIDDDEPEGDETVLLLLSSPQSATLGEPGMATLTILDDELPAADVYIYYFAVYFKP